MAGVSAGVAVSDSAVRAGAVVSAQTMMPAAPKPPKTRPTISRERVRVIAHQMVDGLAGTNPAVYYHLNQYGDITPLMVHIQDWLDSQGVDLTD